jgi:hypothetical protein
VVDALERIHAALADDGVVVDTQPVSARPTVVGADGRRLGTLDMDEWAQTIAAIDARIVETIDRGLFSVVADDHVVVADAYDDLTEFVEAAGQWAGTRVPRELIELAEAASGAVDLHQDVRVRVLTRE